MDIGDVQRASSCLERIGYYRLSAYWYPFRASQTSIDPVTGKSKTIVLDNFRAGTRFQDAVDFYVFDKKLRLIVLDAIERIEIGLRADISILMGKADPWAHRNGGLLHGNFSKKMQKHSGLTRHAEWLARVDHSFANSKEDFAKHFKSKYSGAPTIWISVEHWEFGTLSHFFSGLTVQDQDQLSNQYQLPDGKVLASWLRTLNDIRNLCAHHSRLWNRPLANHPAWPAIGTLTLVDHVRSNSTSMGRFYAAAIIMRQLLQKINPASTWSVRFSNHINSIPAIPQVTLQSAGFPANWCSEKIWQ
ncbi:abi family protein [Ochrobactrum sp. CDB2]|nr:abi family protein [Ochrobactrum sp. CDB2]